MIIHICMNEFYRLRLDDGTHVFMEWHHYCGAEFYRDKDATRLIDNWWDNPLICRALDWFQGRGNKA